MPSQPRETTIKHDTRTVSLAGKQLLAFEWVAGATVPGHFQRDLYKFPSLFQGAFQ